MDVVRQIFTRFMEAGRPGVVRLLCDAIDAALDRAVPEAREYLADCLRVLRRVAAGEEIYPERLECDVVMTAQFITLACGGHAGTQAVCAVIEGAGYAAIADNDFDAAHAALAGLLNAIHRDGSLHSLAARLAGGEKGGCLYVAG